MKENHKNLTSNAAFEDLPKWFQESKTENAVVIYADGHLTWVDGIWKDGTWEYGIWCNGKWKNGVWKNGVWKDGVWKDGLWKDGIWGSGVWENGKMINVKKSKKNNKKNNKKNMAVIGKDLRGSGCKKNVGRKKLDYKTKQIHKHVPAEIYTYCCLLIELEIDKFKGKYKDYERKS